MPYSSILYTCVPYLVEPGNCGFEYYLPSLQCNGGAVFNFVAEEGEEGDIFWQDMLYFYELLCGAPYFWGRMPLEEYGGCAKQQGAEVFVGTRVDVLNPGD